MIEMSDAQPEKQLSLIYVMKYAKVTKTKNVQLEK
jgi:hypothetical protein